MVSRSGNMNNTVAIVEDEINIRETVAFALRKEGYLVETYGDGHAAWSAFEKALPDLIVLDVLMPRMDGLELCRRVRGISEQTPIIFLTSRDEEIDRVLGLEIGADDYLCKPFSMRELLARVRVLFRRAALHADPSAAAENVVAAGEMRLDRERYQVQWKGASVRLTVTEFLILLALVRRPGVVRSRRQLMEAGYAQDRYVSERTIDSHIKRVRKRFQEVDPAFAAIETVHGLGYRYRLD